MPSEVSTINVHHKNVPTNICVPSHAEFLLSLANHKYSAYKYNPINNQILLYRLYICRVRNAVYAYHYKKPTLEANFQETAKPQKSCSEATQQKNQILKTRTGRKRWRQRGMPATIVSVHIV